MTDRRAAVRGWRAAVLWSRRPDTAHIGRSHHQLRLSHPRAPRRLISAAALLCLLACGGAPLWARPSPQSAQAPPDASGQGTLPGSPAPRGPSQAGDSAGNTGDSGRTPDNLPDCSAQSQENQISAGHLIYLGDVECELPEGVKVSADSVDIRTEDNKSFIIALGGVVFWGRTEHISAERVEYDTRTGNGTFYTANGYLSLEQQGTPASFGRRDPLVYFYGEKIEKLGPRRYRVTKGSFTSCEQPTPRWVFVSSSMMLNLDDYVVARHTVLRVKGVPLFYAPWFYYPIQSDDRATGFLMPTYGTSTFRGQALSNGFFWAIDRSHDATFMHDWFTRAGQGAGAEYRYVTSPQSSGTFEFYRFWRRQTELLPANTSYEVTGTAVQTLWRTAMARARIDYFSDVQNQQLLHQNLYEASRRNRLIETGLSAPFGPLSTNVLYQRNEVISDATNTIVYGTTPRVTAALAPRQLFQSPLYASANTDYGYLVQRRLLDGVVIQDDSFGRFDVAPSIRAPLSRLSYLTVNASATYRVTSYSREAGTATPTQPGSYVRQYASVRTELVGPVLTRIWDLEGGRFAERLKHVIEPTLTMDVTSPIPEYRRTPIVNDISDFIVGGSSRFTYGITNRLFSRGRTVGTARGTAREFVTVGVQQTYYTQPEASRYDTTYQSSIGTGTGRDLSPIALDLRVTPTATLESHARIEYDVSGIGMKLFSTGATLNGAANSVTLNYSRQRFARGQPASGFLTSSLRTRLLSDQIATTYNLSVDVARHAIVSQGVIASYMAQCCGIQGEFQQFNYPTGTGLPLPSDRRFNLSFVLAGIGTFSNFLGAFGGR